MHLYALSNESEEYRRARDELLTAEMALRDQREQVAEMRRGLPAGPLVDDYVFREGPADLSQNEAGDYFDTRLSELFEPGKSTLIIEHLMYGPDWDDACPMCAMWLDGYNGIMRHVRNRTSLAIVARADIGKIRGWAAIRGWNNLRLLSSHDNSFTQDFGMEQNGGQMPGISVFTKEADGQVRAHYTHGAVMAKDQYRGLDLYSPVWQLFDLLPEGRGEWLPKLDY